jgi:hypothetical protein
MAGWNLSQNLDPGGVKSGFTPSFTFSKVSAACVGGALGSAVPRPSQPSLQASQYTF